MDDSTDDSQEDNNADDNGSEDTHSLIVAFSFIHVFHQASLALITWLRYPDPRSADGYRSPAPAAGFPPEEAPQ